MSRTPKNWGTNTRDIKGGKNMNQQFSHKNLKNPQIYENIWS